MTAILLEDRIREFIQDIINKINTRGYTMNDVDWVFVEKEAEGILIAMDAEYHP